MHNYVKQMAYELESCRKEPLFEIPVKKISTGEKEWISCEVFLAGNSIKCLRDAVSDKEEKSKNIAFSAVVCDSCFDLDWHLNELYSEVLNDIELGGMYNLTSEGE